MHSQKCIPWLKNEGIIYNALERHHNNGAIFISPYYLEIKPEKFLASIKEHEKFSINEKNTAYYSSSFYHALQRIMKE